MEPMDSKVENTGFVRRAEQKLDDALHGPHRGRVLAGLGALGLFTAYRLGPGRVIRYAPLAVKGIQRIRKGGA